jgi:hypothetical protein
LKRRHGTLDQAHIVYNNTTQSKRNEIKAFDKRIEDGKVKLLELKNNLKSDNCNKCHCKNCHPTAYVQLHDTEGTCIYLGECPYGYDWTQEAYVIDYYAQYKNHQMPNGVPLNKEPHWLKEYVVFLQLLYEKEQKKKEEAMKAQGKNKRR